MENTVRVKDIQSEVIAPPYSLHLARAVTGPYMDNGARYLSAHFERRAPGKREFLLTGIVDETTPHIRDTHGKLMIQGGAQHGCSARECRFCVFDELPFYGNLNVQEIVDIFRILLFLYTQVRPFYEDERTLDFKFTDNGEPLENRNLIIAINALTELFGVRAKKLLIKISSIFRENSITNTTFDSLCKWQADNHERASIHLQISRPYSGSTLMPGSKIAEVIKRWKNVNPSDTVCITPGLSRGFDANLLYDFCRDLERVRSDIFLRIALIKPSHEKQRAGLLLYNELEKVRRKIVAMGFDVRPLPNDQIYQDQLRGAGTLSHLPNGNFFDPKKYKVWEYGHGKEDPNV